MSDKSYKRCTCCGGYAGEWEQWPNQDTGTGLCGLCVTWIQGRNTVHAPDEFIQLYGYPGVHYEGAPIEGEFTVNGWTISPLPEGWNFSFEATKGNFGEKFYSQPAAISHALTINA